MRAAYKVIVWGPGIVGNACLKEVIKKSELELVGVLAYSDSKNGVDVGEYLGMDAVGVKMTTDQEAVIAIVAGEVLFSVNMSWLLYTSADADEWESCVHRGRLR